MGRVITAGASKTTREQYWLVFEPSFPLAALYYVMKDAMASIYPSEIQ